MAEVPSLPLKEAGRRRVVQKDVHMVGEDNFDVPQRISWSWLRPVDADRKLTHWGCG